MPLMPSLPIEMHVSAVLENGAHHGFTSLAYWNGDFYLAYISSPSHFYSKKSKLVVLRSQNREEWKEIKTFASYEFERRDPKLCVLNDRLYLFALKNKTFDPMPYGTQFSSTSDGENWEPFQDVDPFGWLFSQPKTTDGKHWFVSAHSSDFSRVSLLKSDDGHRWEIVSGIMEEKGADETALEFRPDGILAAVVRYQRGSAVFGSSKNGTRIFSASAPYSTWTETGMDYDTRLDGPALVSIRGEILAIGRRQTKVAKPFLLEGSVFGRKRTAVFRLRPDKLEWLFDLPSNGDTAYAGAAVMEGSLWISYYSSRLDRDYPWLTGMFRSTGIYLVRLTLEQILNVFVKEGSL